MSSPTEISSCENYRVEESVGYLLSRARMKLAKSMDLALGEYGITHAQGGILVMLASGKYSAASELARELYIDSASMTRMLDRLEKRGFIIRMPRGVDRRIIKLQLTAAGARLAQRLPKIFISVVNRSFAGFKPEELDSLRAMLRKLLAGETDSEPIASLK